MSSSTPSQDLNLTVPSPFPQPVTLKGRTVILTPLAIEDASPLYKVVGGSHNASLFDYMFQDPSPDLASYTAQIRDHITDKKQVFFAIKPSLSSSSSPISVSEEIGDSLGYLCLMNVVPANRVLEVGCIMYSPPLQRTVMATEVMYLLAKHVFEDLHYRRYEWKCNDANAPSKRAAERLGFVFEGVFRQHMIVKGKSRNTAWFSMLDREWPVVRRGFEQWLREENFDADGRQLCSLQSCTEGRETTSG
ncbi:hypothetical protein MMC25_004131 [Agyrium rufum]|nr:hypothetical protein [Agyrium rufum]